MRHFLFAKSLVDVTQCSDLRSLQTLLCFILFLISTARLASAHAYIGLACSTTLRLGLHFRSNYDTSLSKQQRELRRDVFWSVVKMDMYASAVLGLPAFIDLQEVDPAIDKTVADCFQRLPPTEEKSSVEDIKIKTSALHLELLRTITRATKVLYPRPSEQDEETVESGRISVSIKDVEKIEAEMRSWWKQYKELLPRDNEPAEIMR